MDTVKDRLLQFLKEERITASEFSRKMGLSPTYLASMRKSMPEEKVERLVNEFPQINRDWLLYGEGDMYREDLKEKGIEPYKLHRHLVPLIPTQARAGSFDDYARGITRGECHRIYSPYDSAQLAITVMGDSMEPKIRDGVTLFIEKIDEKAFIPWGSPLVLDTQNGTLVKCLYPSDKGEKYLVARSYNPEYPPFTVPTDCIIGVYRILGMAMAGVTF